MILSEVPTQQLLQSAAATLLLTQRHLEIMDFIAVGIQLFTKLRFDFVQLFAMQANHILHRQLTLGAKDVIQALCKSLIQGQIQSAIVAVARVPVTSVAAARATIAVGAVGGALRVRRLSCAWG